MKQGGGVGRAAARIGSENRRIAIMLASAPVAVLLAIAAMTTVRDPVYDTREGQILSCYHNGPPRYPGHEEEIRAIVAREGEPEPNLRYGTDEYARYFTSNSRLLPNLVHRTLPIHASDAPGYKMSMMETVVTINWYEAPPGHCVWEHEYIAGGGSLLDLEYDEDYKCYISGNRTKVPALNYTLIAMFRTGSYPAENSTWVPAPYELADEETRALIQRAGPAPNGTSALEYVAQNTRGEIRAIQYAAYTRGQIGLPVIPVTTLAETLYYTGGDAYRAVKMLNRVWPVMHWVGADAVRSGGTVEDLNIDWPVKGEGCVMESYWVGWGNKLTDLGYSEESRCYLAPPEVRAKPFGTPCFP